MCGKNAVVEPDSEIYEGAILGDKVRVGAMSTVFPQTKVWPGKIIPSGSRLGRSVIWGSQEQRPIFSKFGITGDIRGSLTPETITQFGLSYAAFLGEGSKVLVTNDFSGTADLAKRALVVGLRAGGVHVHDGGEVTGRLTRFAVQALGLDGALHAGSSRQEPMGAVIECWDAKGRPLSKRTRGKLKESMCGKITPFWRSGHWRFHPSGWAEEALLEAFGQTLRQQNPWFQGRAAPRASQ